MGVLDSKTRVLDVVLTPTGRAALARGGLNVSYATFTDGQAYYDPSSITGSYDSATDRIMLEAFPSLPQDILSQTTDDEGNLIPASAFGSGSSSTSIDATGKLYSGSNPVSGYQTDGAFSSAVSNIVNMFQTSFSYNTIIGTRPPLDDDTNFTILPTSTTFRIDESLPTESITEIDTADSLFFDKRFANLPQFKFLPPVVSTEGKTGQLGRFRNIKKFNQYSYDDLKREVFGTDSSPVKQRRDIDITDTSISNDLILQMYEVTNIGVTKLDAVDYGEFVDYTDREHPQKRVLFFGKVFLDNTETATYVNIFTVVLD